MSQKVAYVTGGMGGIGTAICQRLHKEGFKVIAGCGPTRDFDKWLAEQKALGYTIYASVGNVGDWDSTVAAFEKVKAEHGTGRNVAPFVELEWGSDAYAIMRDIKKLFDPHGVLNPDVIITDNDQLHLENLKAMPAADPLVDRCIECGFCEPACPSNGLSLTPRQRIVLWRRINHLQRSGDAPAELANHQRQYRYLGIDTCDKFPR